MDTSFMGFTHWYSSKTKTVKFNAENTTVGLRVFTENQNNNTVKLCDQDWRRKKKLLLMKSKLVR